MNVQTGKRRNRNKQPTMKPMNSDATCISYSSIGRSLTADVSGGGSLYRVYCPGSGTALAGSIGAEIVSCYSSAKFQPPTRARWEPSVGTTSTGRVYVGFTDNPEVVATFAGFSSLSDQLNFVKGLGNLVSFPVWQETDIAVPMRLRRKLFDTNETVVATDVNVLDRSMQVTMIVGLEGGSPSTTVGNMWFHDCVYVEGIQPATT